MNETKVHEKQDFIDFNQRKKNVFLFINLKRRL